MRASLSSQGCTKWTRVLLAGKGIISASGAAMATRAIHTPLHRFLAEHREELLARCARSMREDSPEHRDVVDVELFSILYDEVVRALQHYAGLQTTSPLPGVSNTAARFGSERQRKGFSQRDLALHVGTISDQLGQLATREGVIFTSDEYHTFNQCIDTITATAVEHYARDERAELERDTSMRVGFLAHELRNALATARTSFELLRSGHVPVEGRVAEVHGRSLARLEGLIEQTLLAVQVRGGGEARRVRLRLAPLIEDLVEATVLERGIEIASDVAEDFEVDADERLLVSALGNLVQNAVKFTRDRGHIVVRARREPEATLIDVEGRMWWAARRGCRRAVPAARAARCRSSRLRAGARDHARSRRVARRNDRGAELSRQGVQVLDPVAG